MAVEVVRAGDRCRAREVRELGIVTKAVAGNAGIEPLGIEDDLTQQLKVGQRRYLTDALASLEKPFVRVVSAAKADTSAIALPARLRFVRLVANCSALSSEIPTS